MALPMKSEGATNGQLFEQSTVELFAQSGPMPSFADAVVSLQEAVRDMRPDDLSFEVTSNGEGFRMQLRAYRHRK
jgi:hypothetical protein